MTGKAANSHGASTRVSQCLLNFALLRHGLFKCVLVYMVSACSLSAQVGNWTQIQEADAYMVEAGFTNGSVIKITEIRSTAVMPVCTLKLGKNSHLTWCLE